MSTAASAAGFCGCLGALLVNDTLVIDGSSSPFIKRFTLNDNMHPYITIQSVAYLSSVIESISRTLHLDPTTTPATGRRRVGSRLAIELSARAHLSAQNVLCEMYESVAICIALLRIYLVS